MNDIVLGILLGIILTAVFIYLYIRSLIVRIMHDLDRHIDKFTNTLMPITVERVNDEIFCYDQDNQFICQGKTAQEIRDAMQARYPEKTAYLNGGDAELVAQLRKELKELKESA